VLKIAILYTEIWTQYLPGHWPSWHWGRCPFFHIMIVMVNIFYRFMWPWVKSLLLKLTLQKGPNSVVHEHVPVRSLHLMGCREDVHELMYNNALQRKSKTGNMRMCPWAMCHSLIPSHPLTRRPKMICPAAGVGSVMSGFVEGTVSRGE
jgi:hypothetical protein